MHSGYSEVIDRMRVFLKDSIFVTEQLQKLPQPRNILKTVAISRPIIALEGLCRD